MFLTESMWVSSLISGFESLSICFIPCLKKKPLSFAETLASTSFFLGCWAPCLSRCFRPILAWYLPFPSYSNSGKVPSCLMGLVLLAFARATLVPPLVLQQLRLRHLLSPVLYALYRYMYAITTNPVRCPLYLRWEEIVASRFLKIDRLNSRIRSSKRRFFFPINCHRESSIDCSRQTDSWRYTSCGVGRCGVASPLE